MENNLSERIKKLATSQTLAMAAKARELKSQGKDVIGLSLGEPDFNTPDFIKNAAIKAIQDDYNSYTPVDGYVELKKAIIKKFERDNKLTYDLSQIVVSTGAKQSLSNIAASLINPGDEVIVPSLTFVATASSVTTPKSIKKAWSSSAVLPPENPSSTKKRNPCPNAKTVVAATNKATDAAAIAAMYGLKNGQIDANILISPPSSRSSSTELSI